MNHLYHWSNVKKLKSISPRETPFGYGVFTGNNPYSWSSLGRVLYFVITEQAPVAHRVELSNRHGNVDMVDVEISRDVLATKPSDEGWCEGREEIVFGQKVRVSFIGIRSGSHISSKSRFVWADGTNDRWGEVESGFAWDHKKVMNKLNHIISHF